MNCNNYEDKIISYIENELTDEERAQFKSELDSNPDLREQYDEMRSILISLNKMPKVEASSDFVVKLNYVMEMDVIRNSDYEMGNLVAKSRAKWLLSKTNEYLSPPISSGPSINIVCKSAPLFASPIVIDTSLLQPASF